ncbi:MAG: type I 3-dehydroquinate dehydratase [Chloroflexi bacterium]|nr:type I 3-dehydroquinate dehydratase [Chloroflexota bacterium]
MKRPRICAAIVNEDRAAIKQIEPLVDLFEIRIDLIGSGWRDVAKRLGKPWIACNRLKTEGGAWPGGESERVAELLSAVELGAAIIDIELATENLAEAVRRVKGRASCLISFHDTAGTPSPEKLREVVRKQLAAGADICKVVTTARSFDDNSSVLQLAADFPEARIVSFAMGRPGFTSRVLSPLFGGDFVYASMGTGKESAPGQLTVQDFRVIYGMEA